jgi:hypothetical protein
VAVRLRLEGQRALAGFRQARPACCIIAFRRGHTFGDAAAVQAEAVAAGAAAGARRMPAAAAAAGGTAHPGT